jgi:secreted trypsin-like serine protease
MPRRRLAVLAAAAGLAVVPAPASAIVGGSDAAAGAYPSVANVGIGLPGLPLFGCTGTLIAPRWVLTAGHCSSLTGGAGVATPSEFPPSSFTVTVGGIAADGADGEAVRVDDVQVPSDYLLTNGYDVSLLRLAQPAKTAPTPVAGKGYEALWAAGVTTQIVGFGVTEEDGDAPDRLQRAEVPVIADPECAKQVGDAYEAETQLCAGFPQGGVDSCQGDSGGPMFAAPGSPQLVVGSTSYGEGCAREGKPGVYARVADATLRDGFIRAATPEGVLDAPASGSAQAAPTGDAAPQPRDPAAPNPTPATGPSAGPEAAPAPGTAPAPAPSAPAAGSAPFRAALAVDRTQRRTARVRGVRYRLRCSGACTAKLVLRVDAATARKLRLASRTVGTSEVTRSAAGRTTRSVKLSRALARRVLAARGALTVVATVEDAANRRASVLSARVVLTGR